MYLKQLISTWRDWTSSSRKKLRWASSQLFLVKSSLLVSFRLSILSSALLTIWLNYTSMVVYSTFPHKILPLTRTQFGSLEFKPNSLSNSWWMKQLQTVFFTTFQIATCLWWLIIRASPPNFHSFSQRLSSAMDLMLWLNWAWGYQRMKHRGQSNLMRKEASCLAIAHLAIWRPTFNSIAATLLRPPSWPSN